MNLYFAGLTAKAFEIPDHYHNQSSTSSQDFDPITNHEIDNLGQILEKIQSFEEVIRARTQETGTPFGFDINSWQQAIHNQFHKIPIIKQANNDEINRLIIAQESAENEQQREAHRERQQQLADENKRLHYIEPELKHYLKKLYEWLSQQEQSQLRQDDKCVQIAYEASHLFECVEGFHESVQRAVNLTYDITTIKEILCQIRTNFARDYAEKFLHFNQLNDQGHGVHNHAWLLNQAYHAYQTMPQTQNNIRTIDYMPNKKHFAIDQLHEYFQQTYQHHKIIPRIIDTVEDYIIKPHLGENYENKFFNGLFFDQDYHSWFTNKLQQLFLTNDDSLNIYNTLLLDEDYCVTGINWPHINYTLWQQLKQQHFLVTKLNYQDLEYPYQQAKAAYYLVTVAKLRHSCFQQNNYLQHHYHDSEAAKTIQQDLQLLDHELTDILNNLKQNNQLVNIGSQALEAALPKPLDETLSNDTHQMTEAIIQAINHFESPILLTILRSFSIDSKGFITKKAIEQLVSCLRNNLEPSTFVTWLMSIDPISPYHQPNLFYSTQSNKELYRPTKRFSIVYHQWPELCYNFLEQEGANYRDYLYSALPNRGNPVSTISNQISYSLHEAIKEGDDNQVRQIINQYPNAVFTPLPNTGDSPLMQAAELGYVAIANIILNHHPESAELLNEHGETALEKAANNGHVNVIKAIIHFNPDVVNLFGSLQPFNDSLDRLLNQPTLTDSHGFKNKPILFVGQRSDDPDELYDKKHPLTHCLNLFEQDPTLLNFLLYHGANPNLSFNSISSPLWEACALNLSQITAQLIANGASIEGRTFMGLTNNPLNHTTALGHIDTMRVLIEYGANLNIPYDYTPLQVAANNDYNQIAKMLIEHGADPQLIDHSELSQSIDAIISYNTPDHFNQLPLFGEILQQDVHGVHSLLRQGAVVNIGNEEQETPLELAIHNPPSIPNILDHNWHIIKLLIEYNASITPVLNQFQAEFIRNNRELFDMLQVNCPDENGDTPLVKAIKSGDNSHVIQQVITEGALVNKYDDDHRTPLHYAAMYNRPNIIIKLISLGADTNITDLHHNLPLHLAAAYSNQATLSILFDLMIYNDFNNANTTLRNLYQETPIDLAILHDNYEAVDFLAKKRAFKCSPHSIFPSTIHKAICRQRTISAEILHEYHPYTNIQSDLMAAVIFLPSIINLLIRDGAEPNEIFCRGQRTALHIAVQFGCFQALEILINHTDSIDIKDPEGFTPLHRALHHQQLQCAYLLINQKAQLATKNKDGTTLLDTAIWNADIDMIRTLIDAEVLSYQQSCDYRSVLRLAITRNQPDIVSLLLRSNITHQLSENESKSVLDLVRVCPFPSDNTRQIIVLNLPFNSKNKKQQALEKIIDYYAIEQAQHKKNLLYTDAGQKLMNLPHLTLAAGLGDCQLMQALIQAGAYINIKDTQGNTPLHFILQDWRNEQQDCGLLPSFECNIFRKHWYKINTTNVTVPLTTQEQLDIIDLLIDQGADVNAQNTQGDTPLHIAIEQTTDQSIVQKLIDYGANTSIVNYNNFKPTECMKGANYSVEKAASLINYLKIIDPQLPPSYLRNCLVASFDREFTLPQVSRCNSDQTTFNNSNHVLKTRNLAQLQGCHSPLRHQANRDLHYYIPPGNAPIQLRQLLKDLQQTLHEKLQRPHYYHEPLSHYAHTINLHRNIISQLFSRPKSWHQINTQLTFFSSQNNQNDSLNRENDTQNRPNQA